MIYVADICDMAIHLHYVLADIYITLHLADAFIQRTI